MIDPLLRFLRCPVCAAVLARPAGASPAGGFGVRCARGHSFDVEKSGYLNLRTGRSRRVVGDTAEMVRARVEFLGRGHFDPLTTRLTELAAAGPPASADGAGGPRDGTGGGNEGTGGPADGAGGPGLVLEIGAGTAHHLAGVLAGRAGSVGLAVDVSRYALRRAARAHPGIGAVAFDVAAHWPLPDACVDVLLDVFAPRNIPEMRRLLRPGGLLIVVTPGAGHLAQLREPLGLVGVHPAKRARLDDELAGRFVRRRAETLTRTLRLDVDEVVDLALMGPTGHHLEGEELRRRVDGAFGTGPVPVTVSFEIDCLAPADQRHQRDQRPSPAGRSER